MGGFYQDILLDTENKQVCGRPMVLPTFAETKVGRTEGYQLQFEKPILRLHCDEPMTFK